METFAKLCMIAAVCIGAGTPSKAGCFVGHRRQVYRQKQNFYPVAVYYQVGAGLREQSIADEAARKAIEGYAARFAALEQKLLQFRGRATIEFEGEASAEGGVSGGGVDIPPDAPQPPGNTPDGVLGIFASKCVRCHRAGHESGLDLTVPVNDADLAAQIFLRTFSDKENFRMPPDGNLTDEERQVLFEFAEGN